MKIFRLRDPALAARQNLGFREILVTGTWHAVGSCKVDCRATAIGTPLVIEAGEEGKILGDFSWSLEKFVASDKAVDALKRLGDHWTFEPITVSTKSRARKALAAADYRWPVPHKEIEIDPVINGLTREVVCEKCLASRWSYKHTDIVFPKNAIDELDCFRIDRGLGYKSQTYVTEHYWHALAKWGLTNLGCEEAGVTEN